ncbi:S-layer homology domain-containing protein [Selenomonadales bacterium OttesenSCG-928-I06]|nr:S-layer homology domain-containing protein [Selenomonadales bacterium OttesenSCG-928-I06]
MKKSVALALAAAMSLSVAGTALANNPFSDVPQGHWAYDAVAQLEKDGLVTGYGDGTYRGDRAMSRYEMATVVAQLDDASGENAELINKLRSEFATELYNLGVRVDKLEKNASTIKFSGDGWIRYQSGGIAPLMSFKDNPNQREGKRWQSRIRINMNATINEKVKFLGRVKYQANTARTNPNNRDPAYSYTQDTFMDRAEIVWTNGTFQGRFGRIAPMIGQGLIWGNKSTDGVLLGYKTKKWDIFGGVLDYRPQDPPHGDSTSALPAAASKNATVVNVGYKFSDKFGLTAAYSNGHKSEAGTRDEAYPFELMAFGFSAQLGKDWKLNGEYIKNDSKWAVGRDGSKQDSGYWTRLTWKNANMAKPGTYSIFVEYMDLEAYAIDSATYGHMLNLSAGNGFNPTQYNGTGAAGAKGYGVVATYVVAKNINMQLMYHDLKPTDKVIKDAYGDYRNVYQFYTNFRF